MRTYYYVCEHCGSKIRLETDNRPPKDIRCMYCFDDFKLQTEGYTPTKPAIESKKEIRELVDKALEILWREL
jgi:DNA-directed RNA polymerase subunit RPC12/RpoP